MSERKIARIAYVLVAVILVVTVILLVTEPEAPAIPAETESTKQTVINRQEKTVGVCLPDGGDAWADTGSRVKANLEETGYQVLLVSGDGTTQTQINLLLSLLDKNVACIITTPVDSAALREVSEAALQKNIPIISYGALWMDTAAVRGYICYDYYEMGAAAARRGVEELDIANAEREKRFHTVELFMGAPEDYNAKMFYDGVMSQLQPWVDKGVLKFGSGRSAFEDCCVAGWAEDTAAKLCAARLKKYKKNKFPDLCICASDGIAAGVIGGFRTMQVPEGSWPLITGNGATEEGLQNLSAGLQILTVSTDPAAPAGVCGAMVDLAIYEILPSFPLKSVNNNVTQVLTAVCGFTLVDKE